jgi:hypothetical protein
MGTSEKAFSEVGCLNSIGFISIIKYGGRG